MALCAEVDEKERAKTWIFRMKRCGGTADSKRHMGAALTELGAWLAALIIAYRLDPRWPRYHLVLAVAAVMLVRMLSSHYDDRKRLRAIAAYQKRHDAATDRQ